MWLFLLTRNMARDKTSGSGRKHLALAIRIATLFWWIWMGLRSISYGGLFGLPGLWLANEVLRNANGNGRGPVFFYLFNFSVRMRTGALAATWGSWQQHFSISIRVRLAEFRQVLFNFSLRWIFCHCFCCFVCSISFGFSLVSKNMHYIVNACMQRQTLRNPWLSTKWC